MLAGGLGSDTEDLLELHPEIPNGDRTSGFNGSNGIGRGFRVGLRELAMMGLGILALVIGVGFLAWSTASSECFEVGAGLGNAAPAFRRAYDAGRGEFGSPTEEVREWGDGVSKPLEGGSLGTVIILSLDRRNADVIPGYIRTGAGPPTSGVGGLEAMVQNAAGSSYEWLYGDIWAAYSAAGGPAGPLGRPTAAQARDDGALSATFEDGSIIAPFGSGPVVTGSEGPPLDLATCSPVAHDIAARPSK